jgi:hypothetical protein
MIRNLISFAVVVLIISSCSNTGKKEASSRPGDTTGTAKVEFALLMANPADYLGKTISVEGKVVHVCTHSGKKLFITGENPDVMLYVQAGEEMPKFPMELLGSKIVVEGTLTKATAMAMEEGAGMKEGEGMHEGMNESEKMSEAAGTDTCVTEKALVSQPVLSDLMMVYNKHTLVK